MTSPAPAGVSNNWGATFSPVATRPKEHSMDKRVLMPERLRRPPTQFSWVDQRLVRDGYIRRCHPEALALYLFLVTVADARGLSFWGDASISHQLALSPATLAPARAELMAAGLIAWEAPLYQVLALDPPPSPGVEPPSPESAGGRPRHGAPQAIAACLRRALEASS
jgi:hypothetical protein